MKRISVIMIVLAVFLTSSTVYAKDDKVSHNDKHWISLVDANVWEPGAVGTEALWSEVE